MDSIKNLLAALARLGCTLPLQSKPLSSAALLVVRYLRCRIHLKKAVNRRGQMIDDKQVARIRIDMQMISVSLWIESDVRNPRPATKPLKCWHSPELFCLILTTRGVYSLRICATL